MGLMSAGVALACLGVLLLYFVYDGYGRVLGVISAMRRAATAQPSEVPTWPTVSVVIPVFNEQSRIRAKLDNVLGQNYPRERLDIIVVSDGSTDATESIVGEFADSVRLLRTGGRLGKSLAQNEAVAQARGDVIVLTDAAAVMDRNCVRSLVAPFSDERVGCVSARLLFGASGSVTGADQNRYWNYELKLRRLESGLGLLATAAGPAMAIRRDLWKPLPAQYGDDCVLPLDVILRGKKVVQAEDAVAWDENFASARKEFRARVRMTVRNWTGTFSRATLLNPLRDPGYALALWSHKILRWLSPIWLAAAVAGCLLIAGDSESWWLLVFVIGALACGVIGIVGLFSGRRLPLFATAGSFLLANVAFLVGLMLVLRGQAITVYQNQ
jgi:cellulose synthase/poly-beta-1,6-N-acetylglucosamine synthase-like glycosyltransferase